MMIRNNRSRKFSVKYRIEKWIYEDSKKDIIRLFKCFGLFALCLAFFGCLFIFPALFH
jgi:hypothetical protein